MRKKALYFLLGICVCLSMIVIFNVAPVNSKSQREVKILFVDTLDGGLWEGTILYPFIYWQTKDYNNMKKTGRSVIQMTKEGWALKQIVPINAKQFYFLFEK